MRRYVRQSDNSVHYIADIRRENPNVSIPDDADCSDFGYEFLIETVAPQQYGYSAVEVAPVGNTQTWELVAIPMTDLKAQKTAEIKTAFLSETADPVVDTGLGFSVDGGYKNKTDFETGKKYALPQVRASDNTMHVVTLADYDTIISAIEQNGVALYQKKWTLEAQIGAATTIAELEAVVW